MLFLPLQLDGNRLFVFTEKTSGVVLNFDFESDVEYQQCLKETGESSKSRYQYFKKGKLTNKKHKAVELFP